MSIRPFCSAIAGVLILASIPYVVSVLPAPAATAQTQAEDESLDQRPLTEKQIESLLAGQDAIIAIIDKVPEDERDQPNPQVEAALDKASQAAGFRDYAEFDAVASNVKFLLEGFDPATKQFIGHVAVIKAEIAEIEGDSQMRPRAKAKRLAELNAMMSDAPAVRYPANIAEVSKFYDRLKDMFDEDE